MARLQELHELHDQSPWLDNLKRSWLHDGGIEEWIARGVRGITSNPSIFQKSIESGEGYGEQLLALTTAGHTIEDTYWRMVVDDIRGALDHFGELHIQSGGVDGKVSVEVSPLLAHDTEATIHAARWLRDEIDRPNLLVKIPATNEGVPAIRQMISEGTGINVTLIFSLDRHAEVIEAYVSGLEGAVENGIEDLSSISSVASFFISRVDTEIDRRLSTIATPEALDLRGRAAVAQGQLAFALAAEAFRGERWEALAIRGARPQRPLWASTSTKNKAYPDTLYVDALIGPGTVNTLPDATLVAFEDHGSVARTVDVDLDSARAAWAWIASLIDLVDVGETLESEGVAAFESSFRELLLVMESRAHPAA